MLKIGRPSKYTGPVIETSAQAWQQLTGTQPLSGGDDLSAFYDQNTKSYREIFAGNITESMTDANLAQFIGEAMIKLGLTGNHSLSMDTDEIPSPVMLARISGKYSFIEMKTAEDACNILNLNGIPFMGTNLKISRPTKFDGVAGMGRSTPRFYDWEELYQQWSNGKLRLLTSGTPSNVVMILNMATNAQLADPIHYFDVIEDARAECSLFGGSVLSVIVPRAAPSSNLLKGIGRVFVEMASVSEAEQVILGLKGRTYNGRFVDMKFFPADQFHAMNYSTFLPHLVLTASHGATQLDRVLNEKTIAKLRQSKS
eukprot:CAMPEP_0170065030 /NCGR_PEP_ID=MMETSP0019_2-20121128/5277_1 /TAXON_ID=98059 /ORGANISM="Dinobryon sp., Strain UTEXLB2267" /LENGTH=312 /DNA_ID=CAMNT_0010271811 /DNA_START=373 /DNA_END=1311 /DNA_ORIENTATION=-